MGLTWSNRERDIYLSYRSFGFDDFREAVARLLGSTLTEMTLRARNLPKKRRKRKKVAKLGVFGEIAFLFLASESCDAFDAGQCRLLAHHLREFIEAHPESWEALEWFAREF